PPPRRNRRSQVRPSPAPQLELPQGRNHMVLQVANEVRSEHEQDEGYVPYVSAGGRSLRPELRSAAPPCSRPRWSELPEEDRQRTPVSDEELALLFETRRKLIIARVRRMLRWGPGHEIIEE